VAHLTFWFEFASTYSYLTAMRIEEMAHKASVRLIWKPFLLGPIFKAQGWETSPFNLYRSKGFYMIRDIQRIAEERGMPFRMPNPFPQNGLLAARLALAGLESVWGPVFIRAVYKAEFAEGKTISDSDVMIAALAEAGADPTAAFARAEAPEIKAALRTNTEEAQ
jgi:2-hydroxychromene-2-carboxylate isomerase